MTSAWLAEIIARRIDYFDPRIYCGEMSSTQTHGGLPFKVNFSPLELNHDGSRVGIYIVS